VSDMANALRATSDALMADLDELHKLEREKRRLEPGSPRLVRLAEEIEALAARVMGASMRQRRISQKAEALVEIGHPDAPDRPIREVAREIHVILAEWRDTERQFADAAPDSAEADVAERTIDRLRREYRRAHEAARRRTADASGGPGAPGAP
jgi:hypothetical protein